MSIKQKSTRTKSDYRALLARFDAVFGATDTERCYQLTDQQIVALLSQTNYLHWRTRYTRADGTQDFTDFEIDQMQALAADLEHRLITPSDCTTCDDDVCVEYAPSASFITYHPSDPHNPDDQPPDGYAQPPFYVIDQSFVGGYLPGDVLCDITSTSPVEVWDYLSILFTSGAPRIRVTVEGSGQVELHLLKIAFGGMALVWKDDDYSTADVVDLQSYNLADVAPGTLDLLAFIDNAIDGDFSDVLIHEVFFDTPGTHHIDISFLPILDVNIFASGWGGGLRKVILCGFDQMAIVPVFRVISIGGGCNEIQVKYNNEPDSAYVTLTTVCDGDDGAPGTPGAPGSDCDCPEPDPEAPGFPDTPIGGVGTDVLCNFASYMVDEFLPPVMAEFKTAAEQGQLLGVVAAIALLIAMFLTWGTAALFYVGTIGGAAVGGLVFVLMQTDPVAFQAEMDEVDFWTDVKCVIYCNMSIDGILDQEAANAIADAFLADFATDYPVSAPVLAAAFREFTSESRALMTTYGTLYDGSGCEVCDCNDEWSWAFHDDTQQGLVGCRPHPSVEIIEGYFDDDPAGDFDFRFKPEFVSTCLYRLTLVVDLRQYETVITKIGAGSPLYGAGQNCGGTPRDRILEGWDESTGQWFDIYRGTNYLYGAVVHDIVPQTRMVRLTLVGNTGGDAECLTSFAIWGRRAHVLYDICAESLE